MNARSNVDLSPGCAMNEKIVSPGCAYGGCTNSNSMSVVPAVIAVASDAWLNVTS